MSPIRAWFTLGVFVVSNIALTRWSNAQEAPPTDEVAQDMPPPGDQGTPTQSEPQTPAPEPLGAPGPQPPNPPATAPSVPTATPAANRPETVGPAGRKASETIIVTGSRIPRKDLTTPAPVTVISGDQIRQSGRITLGEYLQNIPEQGNSLNTQVNNGGNGATRVDLRGLGNLRTLVLINGKRMVFTGTGINSGTGVDLNTIPTEAVERIEVLKDGASAVYGSDAIAGVVNIITKKNYQGTAVNGYAGVSKHKDAQTYEVDATTGTAGDRGSLLFSAGFFDQQPAFAGDRSWSAYQLGYDFASGEVTRIGSSRVPSGRVYNTDMGAANAGNATWQDLVNAFPDATTFTYDPTNPISVNGYRPFRSGGLPPKGDLYNFQTLNYNITPNRRINLYSTGTGKLGDYANIYYDASYTSRTSDQQLAEEPLIIGAGGSNVVISANNIYNPFGRDFNQYTKRLVEFGPRIFSQQVDTFRVVGGFNGTLPDPIGWSWDASLNYGRTAGTFQNQGSLIVNKLQEAVGPSFRDADGTPHCGTVDAPIANCVPVNLFQGAGAISPTQAANLTYTGISRIQNQLTTVELNTAGELVRLLAERPVGLALGYQYRYETGADIPDPITAAGESTGNVRKATQGGFHANEAYAELSLPILDNMPFFESLEADAAVRFVDYNTFGNNWSYKFGARWQVIEDFTLRGTYSTAFRAPSITELYLGKSDNFPSVSDPCANSSSEACQAAGVPVGGSKDTETQLRSQNGGNPNLQPETAKIVTAGVVFQPHWVPNLSVTVDYYWISVDKSISTYGASYILSQCYPSSGLGNPDFCKLIQRDANHFITNIQDLNINVGGDKTAGVDLSLRYTIGSPFGRWGLAWDGTYLAYFDRTLAGGTVAHGKGTYDLAAVGNLGGGTGGVYPTFKWLGGVSWGMEGFGAGVQARYIGGFKECADSDGANNGGLCFANPTGLSRKVSPYYLFDLYASYRFSHTLGETNIAIGVRNVFDQDPPVIYNSFTPTSDPTAYDFVGRFFYANVGHRF
jgi:outer membrane receptor protein involved in Fe transport